MRSSVNNPSILTIASNISLDWIAVSALSTSSIEANGGFIQEGKPGVVGKHRSFLVTPLRAGLSCLVALS